MSASRQRHASKGPEGCPVTASRKLCPHQVRSPQEEHGMAGKGLAARKPGREEGHLA